jgi:hypothetical protein
VANGYRFPSFYTTHRTTLKVEMRQEITAVASTIWDGWLTNGPFLAARGSSAYFTPYIFLNKNNFLHSAYMPFCFQYIYIIYSKTGRLAQASVQAAKPFQL